MDIKFFNKIWVLALAGVLAVFAQTQNAAATIDICASFQPVIDIITMLVNNTSSWVGLAIVGIILVVIAAIGGFIKGIMHKAMGGGGRQ